MLRHLIESRERYIMGVGEEILMARMLVERLEEISDGLNWERMLRILLRR